MRRSLSLLVPVALYLAGVALAGDWIIDDAGISYAYARNAAAGHGLVSQPGRPPVEGFSNLLWVVLLMPFFALRLFHPVITAKVLGAALAIGALALVQRALRHARGGDAPGVIAACLLAAAPPLVLWPVSGLENGLTLLLAAALLATLAGRPRAYATRAGALAGLLGAAHPGGLVFALVGPALSLARLARLARLRGSERGGALRSAVIELGAFAAGLGAVLVPLFAFRFAVFGRLLPHTYDAKRAHASFGDRLAALSADPGATLAKLDGLCRGALGPAGPALVTLAIAGAAALAFPTRGAPGADAGEPAAPVEPSRGLPRVAGMSVLLLLVALAGYTFIDDDWMGEHRFGTAAVLFAITSVVSVAAAAHGAASTWLAAARSAPEDATRTATAPSAPEDATRMATAPSAPEDATRTATAPSAPSAPARAGAGGSVPPPGGRLRSLREPFVLAGAALIAMQCALALPRMITFTSNPPTPLAHVERDMARRFDAYAAAIGRESGSVLLPDVGAMLLASRLTVYDAAGLCEPDVVRTLKRGGPVWLHDHPAFYDLVFDDLRPTFLSTHHFWTLVTALDRDPRFARDYVAIDAYRDEYVQSTFGVHLRSGDFVRRDALPDPGALDRIRASYTPLPRPDPPVVRLLDALWGPGRGADSGAALSELRAAAAEALRANDPDRAASLHGRVLARRPADLDAVVGLASALDAAVRPGEARAWWQRALELAPQGSPVSAAARDRLAGLPLLPAAP